MNFWVTQIPKLVNRNVNGLDLSPSVVEILIFDIHFFITYVWRGIICQILVNRFPLNKYIAE